MLELSLSNSDFFKSKYDDFYLKSQKKFPYGYRGSYPFFADWSQLGSTNPQYAKRLFIDLPVHYMKSTTSEHGENMVCAKIVLNVKTKTKKPICVHNMY